MFEKGEDFVVISLSLSHSVWEVVMGFVDCVALSRFALAVGMDSEDFSISLLAFLPHHLSSLVTQGKFFLELKSNHQPLPFPLSVALWSTYTKTDPTSPQHAVSPLAFLEGGMSLLL
jgi:hypothetical protein